MLVQVFLSLDEINTISVRLILAEDNHVPICGRSRNTRGTQLSQKRSPTRLPTNYPPRLAPGTKVPLLIRTGALNWEGPNYLCSAESSEIVSRQSKINYLALLATGVCR
jgi:hypothetical protein